MKIVDINSLQQERERLRLMVKAKEEELETTVGIIRENAGSIIWSLVNPFNKEKLPSTLKKAAIPLASVLLSATPAGAGAKGVLLKAAKFVVLSYGPKWLGKLVRKKTT